MNALPESIEEAEAWTAAVLPKMAANVIAFPVQIADYNRGWDAAIYRPDAENPNPAGTLEASSWQAGHEDSPVKARSASGCR